MNIYSKNDFDNNIKSAKEQLQKVLLPQRRHIMKRCFMTGKQCIFSHYISNDKQEVDAIKHPMSSSKIIDNMDNCDENEKNDLSKKLFNRCNVFVVMPFSPNLETFYQWSLRPYLLSGYGFSPKSVQRADDIRDIGYIVCEKICRQIQESDLVLADVSLKNSNVFYELGLTIGLERPYALMQGGKISENVLDDVCVRQSLSLPDKKENEKDPMLSYPGVGALDLCFEDHRLHRFIRCPKVTKPRKKSLEISILRVVRPAAQSPQLSNDTSTLNQVLMEGLDIGLEFVDILKGAIGVAMAEIRSDIESNNLGNEPWVQVVKNIRREDWSKFSDARLIEVNGKGGFDSIAHAIESSFATIIDVSGNDPVAYFWLGYSHSRGLNAIPVYRTGSAIIVDKSNPDKKVENKLAFDIHALWYAEYNEKKPYEFKTKIREILEHLFKRDLPDRQKRAFWDRFPAEHKLKVFTGAIHIPHLNREMIGDWDLRTVSELFSYLPSIREAMAIELVTPIYSPEQAFRRYRHNQLKADIEIPPEVKKTNTPNEDSEIKSNFIKQYLKHIRDQLDSVNAVVIASPDVNPITEFLLHEIYGVKKPMNAFEPVENPSFNGFVVVKQVDSIIDKEESQVKFQRLFYHEESAEGFRQAYTDTSKIKNLRGFGIHAQTRLFIENPIFFEQYISQDDCNALFCLLGQLVIAKYPRNKDGNLIILLNGVSGPATFALAQILTGGGVRASHEMNAKSEELLEKINSILDNIDCLGVEVIIKVEINPASDWEKQTHLDSRQVKNWDFLLNIIKKEAGESEKEDENLINTYGPKELKI